MTAIEDRCRLVLIVPEGDDAAARRRMLEDALRGGDVASVIVPQYGLDDGEFQKHAEALVPVIQAAGAAALIAGDHDKAAELATQNPYYNPRPVTREGIIAILNDAVEGRRPV